MPLRPRRSRASDEAAQRWHRRPVLAGLVRTGVFVVPIAAAVAAGAIASRVVPRPYGVLDEAVWWLAIFGFSTAVLLLADRLARRFLPLASLLNLSLLFPARAPRRLTLARRVGTVRQLEERLSEARAHGVHDDAAVAAERILTLVAALQLHDRRTRGHAERVRMYTDLLVAELGLPEADADRLRWAALLHDIGKLAVSADLLNKPEALDAEEWHEIRHHPDAGAAYCGPLLAWLGPWGDTIAQHHERWDGDGYPRGLAGEEICYGARIVAVPDAYEVMTAVRPYKPAMSAQAARDELARCAGEQFDPAVVRAFLNLSISRMWWVMGPATWIFQLPFVSSRPKLAATSSVAALGLLGLAILGGGTTLPPAEAEPRFPLVRDGDDVATTVAVTAVALVDDDAVLGEQDEDGSSADGGATDPDGGLVPGDGGTVDPSTDPAPDDGTGGDGDPVETPADDPDSGDDEPDSPDDDGVDTWVPRPPDDDDGQDDDAEPSDDVDGSDDGSKTPAPAADGPDASDDAATIDEGGSVTVAVLANDAGDLDPSTLKVLKGLARPLGSVTVDTVDGTLTFTDGWARKARQGLHYEVCDSAGVCDTATLTVTVTAPAAPRGAPANTPSQQDERHSAAERKDHRSGGDGTEARETPQRTRPSRPDAAADRDSAPTTSKRSAQDQRATLKRSERTEPTRRALPPARDHRERPAAADKAKGKVSGLLDATDDDNLLLSWLSSVFSAFSRLV